MFFPKPNDYLEVVADDHEGNYRVWSENDECIYNMTHADLKHEENLGAEVQWEPSYAQVSSH